MKLPSAQGFMMRHVTRRHVLLVTAAAGVVLTCIAAYPISSAATRVMTLMLTVGVWSGILVLAWRAIAARFFLLAITAFAVVLMLGPGRGLHDPLLAERYAAQLHRFRGTPYLWGGENRLGIDCSGLVRIALVNAALMRGITTLNPSLVRFGALLWWRDRTAQQLGEGYGGDTGAVSDTTTINSVAASSLQIGDLAVTISGVHVLAYGGAGTWIEADPSAREVIEVTVPERANPWFGTPVRIVRWHVFDGDAL